MVRIIAPDITTVMVGVNIIHQEDKGILEGVDVLITMCQD